MTESYFQMMLGLQFGKRTIQHISSTFSKPKKRQNLQNSKENRMRSLEEIRRKINGTMQLAGNTYAGRIRTKKLSGSVVFSFDESGWEHVSVSPYNGKTPTWDDMCEIKDMFWNEEEAVIQIHPKKSEYVNIVDNCLHLWRHKYIELPR